MAKILVTGGAGYIGSHVVKALGEKGYEIVVYDNLSTGHEWAVLYGTLIKGDVCDLEALAEVIAQNSFDAVMHFAARIVVPESMDQPVEYYWNNIGGTLNLLHLMQKYNLKSLIFSSSAAVYGIPDVIPVPESAPFCAINPYGRSKAMVESILKDSAAAGKLNYVALRYFNVAGADTGGRIGEGKENATHLITRCVRAALGLIHKIEIYGSDYQTADGSCIRDYLHIEDLAKAHLLSLEYLLNGGPSRVYNCGYGHGYSVFEVIETIKRVTGADFPVSIGSHRLGDPPILVADPCRIKTELNWQPCFNDLDMIVDSAWRWEKKRLEEIVY